MFALKPNSMFTSMKGHYSLAEYSKLSTLAKLTLLGLVYVYRVKLIDTLYHGIFSPSAVAMVVIGLNILAGLIQLSFFVEPYRQFVPKDKQALMVAAWLTIIGSAVAMLPKFLAMVLLLQKPFLFILLRYGNQIRVLCPWLSATLRCVFCMIFLLTYRFKKNRSLKYAFGFGAIGWLIMASAQFVVLLNYLTAGEWNGLANLFTAGPLVFVTASSLTLLSLSFFYYKFAVID
jgi:hypothetical protein